MNSRSIGAKCFAYLVANSLGKGKQSMYVHLHFRMSRWTALWRRDGGWGGMNRAETETVPHGAVFEGDSH